MFHDQLSLDLVFQNPLFLQPKCFKHYCTSNMWTYISFDFDTYMHRTTSVKVQHPPLEQRGWSQHLRTLTSSLNYFVSSVKDSLKIFYLDSKTWFSTNFWSQSLCFASLSLGFLRWNYLHQELEIGGDHSYRDKEKPSLQHSRQRQVETVIWLWLCPSDWEITDLRFFVPTWLFDGWKSSTRLLHWRWR